MQMPDGGSCFAAYTSSTCAWVLRIRATNEIFIRITRAHCGSVLCLSLARHQQLMWMEWIAFGTRETGVRAKRSVWVCKIRIPRMPYGDSIRASVFGVCLFKYTSISYRPGETVSHTASWIRHSKPREFYVRNVRGVREFVSSVTLLFLRVFTAMYFFFSFWIWGKLGIKYFHTRCRIRVLRGKCYSVFVEMNLSRRWRCWHRWQNIRFLVAALCLQCCIHSLCTNAAQTM